MIARVAPESTRSKKERDRLAYRIARDPVERIQAYRLVYDSYLSKGLIEPNPWGLRVTPYHLLPTTQTFIACRGGDIICTVTLIGDGQRGLPMESIYGREVDEARARGLFVGEVSCLAVKNIKFTAFLPVFVKLTRLMAQFARFHGMDQFLIATHPKHARFYQRFMGFEEIGELKQYPNVQNAPAVACCLDFARIDRDRPACYDQFFGTALPASELRAGPMSDAEIESFSRVIDAVPTHSVPILA